ncbi:unnamed protein product, partial [marine sediment metagenome]
KKRPKRVDIQINTDQGKVGERIRITSPFDSKVEHTQQREERGDRVVLMNSPVKVIHYAKLNAYWVYNREGDFVGAINETHLKNLVVNCMKHFGSVNITGKRSIVNIWGDMRRFMIKRMKKRGKI